MEYEPFISADQYQLISLDNYRLLMISEKGFDYPLTASISTHTRTCVIDSKIRSVVIDQ